jgi:hypothetical protein
MRTCCTLLLVVLHEDLYRTKVVRYFGGLVRERRTVNSFSQLIVHNNPPFTGVCPDMRRSSSRARPAEPLELPEVTGRPPRQGRLLTIPQQLATFFLLAAGASFTILHLFSRNTCSTSAAAVHFADHVVLEGIAEAVPALLIVDPGGILTAARASTRSEAQQVAAALRLPFRDHGRHTLSPGLIDGAPLALRRQRLLECLLSHP